MTLRLLPPLPPDPPAPLERCGHEKTDHEVLDSEALGRGPRVACLVYTCRACRWSWIEHKTRIA